MPGKNNVTLVATDTDPVATAVFVALGDLPGVRRIGPDDFDPSELALGDRGILLIGDSALEAVSNSDHSQIKPGLVQFLGCRPPTALIDQLKGAGTVVAGVSPVMAPRVANRVVGLAGPLMSSVGVQRGDSGPVWESLDSESQEPKSLAKSYRPVHLSILPISGLPGLGYLSKWVSAGCRSISLLPVQTCSRCISTRAQLHLP